MLEVRAGDSFRTFLGCFQCFETCNRRTRVFSSYNEEQETIPMGSTIETVESIENTIFWTIKAKNNCLHHLLKHKCINVSNVSNVSMYKCIKNTIFQRIRAATIALHHLLQQNISMSQCIERIKCINISITQFSGQLKQRTIALHHLLKHKLCIKCINVSMHQ